MFKNLDDLDFGHGNLEFADKDKNLSQLSNTSLK